MNSTIHIPAGDIDLLAVGETLIDFISEVEIDRLGEAETFRRYLGGSPANIAVNVAKLGGRSAVISKFGIGAFGQFAKSELRRFGVLTDYLVMDYRVHTSIVFVARTSGTPDIEALRAGDAQLERSVLFGREVVERKLLKVGPLLSDFNKNEIYARLPDPTDTLKPWNMTAAATG